MVGLRWGFIFICILKWFFKKFGYEVNLVNKFFLVVKKVLDYNKNKMRDIIL